jgi:hypothetical protein
MGTEKSRSGARGRDEDGDEEEEEEEDDDEDEPDDAVEGIATDEEVSVLGETALTGSSSAESSIVSAVAGAG